MVGLCLAVVSGALAESLAPAAALGTQATRGEQPTSIEMGSPGVSVPVRELVSSADFVGSDRVVPPRVNPLAREPDHGARGTWNRERRGPDALSKPSRRARERTPEPTAVFEGTANPTGCGTCTPPDATGDVGPNHYVQLVNATKVAIYDKSGVLQTPVFSLSALFDGADGACSTTNDGDPQVVYDQLADRWLLSQFMVTDSNMLCFAISQTPDPLGAYYTYGMTLTEMPDYFKVGVWPTAYYVGTNETTYTAYALDRANMLAGLAATAIKIAGPANSNFMLPADVDGGTAPDSQGGLFYTFKDAAFHSVSSDMLQMFRFTPDFDTPVNSALTTVAQGPVGGCVTTPARIPRRGTKQLMGRACVTNAGQRVGVSVNSQRRDTRRVRGPVLSCKVGKRRAIATRSTGYGDGTRYCPRGAMNLTTYGSRMAIRVAWAAPVTDGYEAYASARSYTT